ncbi:hypothetical protein SDC9_161270 [bioreactor metagenome]|uniref:Ribbon-helix-helix protein CopG domain-containing protein n=1 Tax=bioreactor metagenome TaxID=1076179 RepID=A0A645FNY4_9ZZZZ
MSKISQKALDLRRYISYNYINGAKEGDAVPPKKMGRPTNDPKELSVRIRLSNDDERMLRYCSEKTNLTKAEIIRRGIREVFQQLQK